MGVGEARQLQTLRSHEVSGWHCPQDAGARDQLRLCSQGVGALSRLGQEGEQGLLGHGGHLLNS